MPPFFQKNKTQDLSLESLVQCSQSQEYEKKQLHPTKTTNQNTKPKNKTKTHKQTNQKKNHNKKNPA